MRFTTCLKFPWLFMAVFICMAGCQSVEGTAQPEVTAVPSLIPTIQIEETARPPTTTPKYTGPIISPLFGQTISDGGQFAPLPLDEYISDEDHSPDEIVWSHSGEEDLNVRITRRVLIVSPPVSNWMGNETISLEACDPDGQCATAQVEYAVEFVNNSPIVSEFDDQLILPGEKFSEIVLDDYVDDADNADAEISWHSDGNAELDIRIDERVASVTPPDDGWRGPEIIQLTACDPGGFCDSAEIVFVVQELADLKITFVANSGFLIEAGGKKIAIDALLQPWDGYQSLSIADAQKMENSRWPFDDINLVIVTHNHFDHFNANVVSTYLENNPDSFLLSTQRVEENLRASFVGFESNQDRIMGLKIKDGEHLMMVIDGIGVELMNFPHGAGAPKNLGVIISIGGFRVLHTGDLDPEQTLEVLAQYDISEKEIDVALVPAFWMTISRYNPLLSEINAPYIIPMHFDPATSYMLDDMQADFPDAVFFRNIYESWELAH